MRRHSRRHALRRFGSRRRDERGALHFNIDLIDCAYTKCCVVSGIFTTRAMLPE